MSSLRAGTTFWPFFVFPLISVPCIVHSKQTQYLVEVVDVDDDVGERRSTKIKVLEVNLCCVL